jgi:hypothetical protein
MLNTRKPGIDNHIIGNVKIGDSCFDFQIHKLFFSFFSFCCCFSLPLAESTMAHPLG